ncbi:hypothetical protein BKA62DRAFT_637497 [Auriculariales sp. MPI-PUGE-AT-0066]|nr:hypothetical protein BKA62DRAFT_637497 [Auriculariales sp. MPI-PUGE-AT-0066]
MFDPDEEPIEDEVDLLNPGPAKAKKGKGGKKQQPMFDPDDVAGEEEPDFLNPAPKGKKTKGKKQQAMFDPDEIEAEMSAEPTTTPAAKGKASAPTPAAAEEDSDDDGPSTTKSKVDKKKAKKAAQKEKAKAVKAGDEPAPEPVTQPATVLDDDADDGDDAGGGKSKDKKKKKKKGAEPAPVPVPAAVKGNKGLAALKAAMEAKKAAEEEARKVAEEERLRNEEEERRAAEEEARKEEEKRRKKNREKEKRELAKKEGRLLTKKQKEERAAADIRRKALLGSGAIVEGLQSSPSGGAPSKKFSYGSRKRPGKGGPASAVAETASTVSSDHEDTAAPPSEPAREDAWDAGSDDEEAAKAAASPAVAQIPPTPQPAADDVEDSVDDWEKDSDEEVVKPAPTPAKSAQPIKGQQTVAASKPSTSKAAPPDGSNERPVAPVTGKGKGPPPPESSEEDSESDSESDSDDSDDDSDDSEEDVAARRLAQKKAEAAVRKAKRMEEAKANASKDNLRSPICCILGHVDTGKTKLLDKIRQTNVQEGEAGGITQQIGATYFPVEAIKQKTAVMNTDGTQEYKIPGLLVIDTPGHESFSNLRTRGSSLCNIAILVVDIMHGLEPQTLESLRLLRDKKTPFIVALNKIDRLFGWQTTPDNSFRDSFAKQNSAVQREFSNRTQGVITEFAEQGLNAVLYYENKSFARNVSLVPTSAITGEGIPDMIQLLVNLTQQRMSDRLMYLSELECTVLEVKVIEGLGTTIDVVLSNGILREGERIVVCGLNGPIVTQIRALLTPQPLRELRVKSAYVHHKEIKAAMGVKISAPDLEKAIAGSRLLVIGPDDDEEVLRDEVMTDLTTLVNSIDRTERGVCVQASTLGSLEALLDFLKVSKIPVSGIGIGPVHKKDIMRAATMVEKAKELACLLCFDVTVDRDIEKLAEDMGVKVFKADIIYHLFDAFTAYNAEITEAKRRDAAPQAIWPCRLKTLRPFAKRDPIILGCEILDGSLRVGTPICVVKKDAQTSKTEIIDLGKITSLEINHKTMDVIKKSQQGAGVAVKIEHASYQSAKMFGRHFDESDELYSHITRASIDILKASPLVYLWSSLIDCLSDHVQGGCVNGRMELDQGVESQT